MEPATGETSLDEAEELLNSDPAKAIEVAQAVAGGGARASWIVGQALRSQGKLAEAEASLREARMLTESSPLAAEIDISLAGLLMATADNREARALLEPVLVMPFGARVRGRAEMQLGMLHHRAGEFGVARERYERALGQALESDDLLGAMRTASNHGLLELYCGRLDEADRLFSEAALRAKAGGYHVVLAVAHHNRGLVAQRQGDGRAALDHYEQARELFESTSSFGYLGGLMIDVARNLADLSLFDEARDAADRAVEVIRSTGSAIDEAEALLYLSQCCLNNGDTDDARVAAARAGALFEEQERTGWVVLAAHAAEVAEATLGGSSELLERMQVTVSQLAEGGWTAESLHAGVLAARLALRLGDVALAAALLRPVTAVSADRPAVERAAAAVAAAMLAAATGRSDDAMDLVHAGLDELESLSEVLGAMELRTHATTHRAELVDVGVDLALDRDQAAAVLDLVERSHSIGGDIAAHAGDRQSTVESLLAELRTVNAAVREADGGDEELARRKSDLERAVQHEVRRVHSIGRGVTASGVPVSEFTDAMGAVIVLHARAHDVIVVEVTAGSPKAIAVAVTEETIAELIETIEFSLNRLARNNVSQKSAEASLDLLASVGRELQEMVLPASWSTTTEAVVIVPSGRLSGVPWAVVPCLRGRVGVVAPSLRAWSEARAVPTPYGKVVVIAGPGLPSAAVEVKRLGGIHDEVRSMWGAHSRVNDVLAELPGASIAHFACHGTFRADNPMFSSLRLADGDLTIYDLEQCERLPHTIVLSACNAGQNAVLRGGALLGMTSALIQLGVSSVIAPLTPVNDERSVDLMVRLHTHLAAGVPAAEALAKASIGPDGELDPAAAPFICFGS